MLSFFQISTNLFFLKTGLYPALGLIVEIEHLDLSPVLRRSGVSYRAKKSFIEFPVGGEANEVGIPVGIDITMSRR